MQDYYDTDSSCVYPLILLALWQIWNNPTIKTKFSTPLAKTKKRVTDFIYLFLMCLNLADQGSFSQIVDYYMLTHLLHGLGEILNTLSSVSID